MENGSVVRALGPGVGYALVGLGVVGCDVVASSFVVGINVDDDIVDDDNVHDVNPAMRQLSIASFAENAST